MNGTFAMSAVKVAQQGSGGGVWCRQAALRANNWNKLRPFMNNLILLLGDDMSPYVVVVCVTIGTLVVVTLCLVGVVFNTVGRCTLRREVLLSVLRGAALSTTLSGIVGHCF